MNEIVLLRHGKPAIAAEDRWLTSAQYGNWISAYNFAGIDLDCKPSAEAIEKVSQCNLIVCSSLQRSIESAHALGVRSVDVCGAIYREFEMPFADVKFLRLSTTMWSGIYRLLWFAGFSKNVESYRDAKQRALTCIKQLTEYAREYERIVFVGHGALLWFLCRELVSKGWVGSRRSPKNYWEFNVYQCRK